MGHGVLDPPTPRVGGTCCVGRHGLLGSPSQGTRLTELFLRLHPGTVACSLERHMGGWGCSPGTRKPSVKGQIVNFFDFAGYMIFVVQKSPQIVYKQIDMSVFQYIY